jgi:hypothetical protein
VSAVNAVKKFVYDFIKNLKSFCNDNIKRYKIDTNLTTLEVMLSDSISSNYSHVIALMNENNLGVLNKFINVIDDVYFGDILNCFNVKKLSSRGSKTPAELTLDLLDRMSIDKILRMLGLDG